MAEFTGSFGATDLSLLPQRAEGLINGRKPFQQARTTKHDGHVSPNSAKSSVDAADAAVWWLLVRDDHHLDGTTDVNDPASITAASQPLGF